MAGYSGTPLPKKLGIKLGHQVTVLRSPRGFDRLLHPLPDEVTLKLDLRGRCPLNVIVLFCEKRSVLTRRFAAAAARLDSAGGLWVAWPKKSSGLQTDLDEAGVRSHGLEAGLVDNKICAIDDTWSGLRFVIRLKDRPTAKKGARR
jgi:hypothetical protein